MQGLSVGGFCYLSDGDSLASKDSKNFLSVVERNEKKAVWRRDVNKDKHGKR